MEPKPGNIIAIDAGVVTGYAVFGVSGELISYGSHNYGNQNRLRAHIPAFLAEYGKTDLLAVEGGGKIAGLWLAWARKTGVNTVSFHAEGWRKYFFVVPDYPHTYEAKRKAVELAAGIVGACAIRKMQIKNHNTAEAILAGVYTMHQYGYCDRMHPGVLGMLLH